MSTPSERPRLIDVAPGGLPNHLYYGDNLTIMREMASNSVDLIYLDPPFNSQRNYNLIYKKLTGQPVPEQEEAFCDAWDLDPEKEEMARKMPIVLREYGAEDDLIMFWEAWIRALRHTQPRLLAYLVYMSYRLFELRRILKSSGTIYLHCDPQASHYIKVIMDGVFGHANFQNEITWKRTHSHGDSRRRYSAISDRILVYSKQAGKQTFNRQFMPYDDAYIEKHYRHLDKNGRRYQLVTLRSPNPRPNLTYDYKGYKPHANGWAVSREKMEQLEAEGRLYFPENKDGAIREKYFLGRDERCRSRRRMVRHRPHLGTGERAPRIPHAEADYASPANHRILQ